MSFSYTGGATAGNSGTPCSITHGLTINEGDLVVAYVNSNSTTAISAGTGGATWTEAIDETPVGETCRQALYWKVANSSEPSSYSFTVGNAQWVVLLKVFSSTADAQIDAAAVSSIFTTSGYDMECDATDGETISDDAVSIVCGGKDNRDGGSGTYNSADDSYTGIIFEIDYEMSAACHRIYTTGQTITGRIDINENGNIQISDDTYSVHVSFVEGSSVSTAAGTISFSATAIADATSLASGTITTTGDLAAVGVSLVPALGTIGISGDLAADGKLNAFAVTQFIGQLIAGGGVTFASGTMTASATLAAIGTDTTSGFVTASGAITFSADLSSVGASNALGSISTSGDLAAIGTDLSSGVVTAAGTITFSSDLAASGTQLAGGTSTFSGQLVAAGANLAAGTVTAIGDLTAAGTQYSPATATITALATLAGNGTHLAFGTSVLVGNLSALGYSEVTAAGTITTSGDLSAVGGVQIPATTGVGVINVSATLEAIGINFCPITASGSISVFGTLVASEDSSDDIITASANRLPTWTHPEGNGINVGGRDYHGLYVMIWESDGDADAVMGGNDSEWVFREDTQSGVPPFTLVGTEWEDGHYFVRNVTKNGPPELITNDYGGVYVHDAKYIDPFGGTSSANEVEWAEGDDWEVLWRDYRHAELRAKGTIIGDGANLKYAYGSISIHGELAEAYLHKVTCLQASASILMNGEMSAGALIDTNQKFATGSITFSSTLDISAIYARGSSISMIGSLSAYGRLLMDGSASLLSDAADLSIQGLVGAGTIDGQKRALIREAYGSIEIYNNSRGGFYTVGDSQQLKEAYALINVTGSLSALGQRDQTKFGIGSISVAGGLSADGTSLASGSIVV